MILIAAFLIASVSSFTAGFFGSGSGLVGIPLFSRLLRLTNVPLEDNMHVVTGTFLAFGLVLMTVATLTQHKQSNVNWKLFWRLFFPTNLGVIAGSIYARNLNNHHLHLFFGIFVLCLAIWSIISTKKSVTSNLPATSHHFPIVGFFVAFTVGMTSMGILTIPYLRKYGVPLVSAIATTQALGILTSLFGALSYIITGWSNKTLPSSCVGYVDWQLLIPLTLGGIIFARFGVKVSHRMSPIILHQLFCIFLLVVGSEMLLTA